MAKKKAPKKGAKRSVKKAEAVKPLTQKDFPKPSSEEVVHYINMKYGDVGPILRRANEAWDASDLRRPSGIVSLDVACGGGLSAGKVSQVDGPEGIGKNYLLYRFFAQAQKNYGERACLAMACFESFVDKHFAQMCGCRIAMSPYDIEVTQRDRLKRGEPLLTFDEVDEAMRCPTVGEFHIFEGAAEKVLDGIIAATRSNIFQLIGVDSWDAMLTAQEDGATLEETPQVASPAMLQTRWAKKIYEAFNPVYRCPLCGQAPLERKIIETKTMKYYYKCKNEGCKFKGLNPAIEVNETTIYCIRQVRDKLLMGGKVYGRPYASKGARGLRHLNQTRVSMHPGKFIEMKIGGAHEKIGKEINWEITKAKGGAREGRTGLIKLLFDPLEVDVSQDLFNYCRHYQIIHTDGSGRYSVPELDLVIRGADSVVDALENDPALFDRVREVAYIKAGLGHVRFT